MRRLRGKSRSIIILSSLRWHMDFLKNIFSSALLIFFLISCTHQPQLILQTQNEKIEIEVEIADDDLERSNGLMYREELADGSGMLFVFPEEAPLNFWMKNTYIPLDILFFNKNRVVISVVENMEPCKIMNCPLYSSKFPAQFALEVPAGFVKKHGVKIGDVMVY